MSQQPHHWIDFRRDSDMQIEAIRAHFTGHAYDPHWHDSYLIGVTEQGIQQFHSRRERHRSRPGTVFLLSLAICTMATLLTRRALPTACFICNQR